MTNAAQAMLATVGSGARTRTQRGIHRGAGQPQRRKQARKQTSRQRQGQRGSERGEIYFDLRSSGKRRDEQSAGRLHKSVGKDCPQNAAYHCIDSIFNQELADESSPPCA